MKSNAEERTFNSKSCKYENVRPTSGMKPNYSLPHFYRKKLNRRHETPDKVLRRILGEYN